jgi:predicted enzyme related to lactoylglutathione lyase
MAKFINVNVVSYTVSDWQGAKKFYAEILGWPVAFGADEVGWFEYGNENETHIAISRWDGPDPRPPVNGGATAVLTVEDAKAMTADLRARGVRCDDPVEIPGMVTYGTFYDPEGNRIQFASS